MNGVIKRFICNVKFSSKYLATNTTFLRESTVKHPFFLHKPGLTIGQTFFYSWVFNIFLHKPQGVHKHIWTAIAHATLIICTVLSRPSQLTHTHTKDLVTMTKVQMIKQKEGQRTAVERSYTTATWNCLYAYMAHNSKFNLPGKWCGTGLSACSSSVPPRAFRSAHSSR